MGDKERRFAGVKRATVGKMGDRERRFAGAERATVGKMGDKERRSAGAERATVGKMGDKERRIAGAERATVGKGARMPEKFNISVTYNGSKNLLSCQKGTSFLKFHDQVQKAFSATGERFTFKEIGGTTDDYVNDQNWENKLKDDMKLLAIGGKQQLASLRIHKIQEKTKYQIWSLVSRSNAGLLERVPNPSKVACSGSFNTGENTHWTTVDETKVDCLDCFAFVFNDAGEQYALKGNKVRRTVTTEVKENIHDESDIFQVVSIGGGIFSLIKLYSNKLCSNELYSSELYLACDQDGNLTLVEDKHPENPSPQILFSFNKVGVVHDN